MLTNPLSLYFSNFSWQALQPRLNQASPADSGASASTTTDTLSLDALNSVPQFLYGKLSQALNKEFGITGAGTTSPDAAPVTFDQMVDRIKSLVAQLKSATDGAPDAISARVRSALQQAAQDSKDVLSHYGKLDATTEQQINDAVAAILAPPANSTPAPADSATDSVAANSSSIASAATLVSINRNQSTSIQIKTRDGDVITIELSKQSSASITTATASSNGAQLSAQLLTQSQSSQLNYSVQGELNQDERHAIEKVLKKIDKIADKFYSGDVTTAFKKARHLGFDAQTLVGVSLSMTSTETTKAISAYKTVGTRTASAAAPAPATTGTPSDVAQFAQGVHDVVTDPAAQKLIANPAQSIAKLVASATQLKNTSGQPAPHSLEELAHALKAIIDAVVKLANASTSAPSNMPQPSPQAIAA